MIFATTRAAAGRLAAQGDKSGVLGGKVKAPRAALGACLKAMSPARPSLTVRGAAGDDAYMARDAGQVSSPFSQANVHRSVEDAASQVDGSLELTTENADKVLDKVRPYLVADGGNCAVAGISNGVVMVELQGACGSCPSSTATMKMGIEQALRAAFGDKVTQVLQVGRAEEPVTVDTVNEHLEMLRPAITAYGGSVNVLSVKGEVCFVQFSGPPPIAQGVQAAIKDKFPTIATVEFQE
eukprot:jgi/Tetstr1/432991/TSEL_022328.t1